MSVVGDSIAPATVALAGLGGLAGVGSANLSAISALACFAFDAAVFVGVSRAAGSAVGEDLTGCEQSRRHDSEDDFHIGITFSAKGVPSRTANSPGRLRRGSIRRTFVPLFVLGLPVIILCHALTFPLRGATDWFR